jgi:hypothetical protein
MGAETRDQCYLSKSKLPNAKFPKGKFPSAKFPSAKFPSAKFPKSKFPNDTKIVETINCRTTYALSNIAFCRTYFIAIFPD